MLLESREIFDFRLGSLAFEDSGTHHISSRVTLNPLVTSHTGVSPQRYDG